MPLINSSKAGSNWRVNNQQKSNVLAAGFLFACVAIFSPLAIYSPNSVAANATLNLKDTDIEVFIESVSRITGKTFVIDPRVKNKKVTVISQHEMNEEEIFALFLSVLQVHQFTAVELDGY